MHSCCHAPVSRRDVLATASIGAMATGMGMVMPASAWAAPQGATRLPATVVQPFDMADVTLDGGPSFTRSA